ncbi:uncharacterized protein LOC142574028 [Dermacentor variabilis]|uniref:uncharacterized protein LOC142574028 n=1 Tax=Dermacentor variabilis TaxID=34621 RepID=UPI003F5CA6A4
MAAIKGIPLVLLIVAALFMEDIPGSAACCLDGKKEIPKCGEPLCCPPHRPHSCCVTNLQVNGQIVPLDASVAVQIRRGASILDREHASLGHSFKRLESNVLTFRAVS